MGTATPISFCDHSTTESEARRQIWFLPGAVMDIPILLYHHLIAEGEPNPAHYEISLRQFEQQLDLLLRWGFSIISLAGLFRILDRLETLKGRVAIITFDDAFQSFFEHALPALRARALSATVFVPAGEIGGTNRWDNSAGQPERAVMSAEQLQEAAAAGMEIGSHGWVHRSLPECSEAEAHEEIYTSRARLHELGLAADFFAYPFGHYSAHHAALVAEAGYRGAVSIFSDSSDVTANVFAMRRIYIHPGDNALRFRLKLSKPYSRYKAVRESAARKATQPVSA
jgi:peptidoglycan/xylan/chitin deacetylase (PgdA/CDA1 family)